MMTRRYHLMTISKMPVAAQVSTLQIKLESITLIIDRLLLAQRQAPWKATGPSGDTTTTDVTTTTDTTFEV